MLRPAFAVLAAAVVMGAQEPDCASCRQHRGSETQVSLEGFVAQISWLDPMTVAAIERQGPYHGSGKALGQLFAWAAAGKVPMLGMPFGVFHDDPDSVPAESTRYEVAVGVRPGTVADPGSGVRVKPWGGRWVATTVHVGPYETMGPTYAKLEKWVYDSGCFPAGPAIEFYLTDPQSVPPESTRTEIALTILPRP